MPAPSLIARRYRLLHPLGEGGSGVVYRAHDVELDRRVALKTLHALRPEAIYGLKREFRALAEVAHPNLVQLYHLVADGEQWFFTMELIEGRAFPAALRRDAGSPDFGGVRDAVRQLVAALGALHARRKLHRDIKPTNVLVEQSGRLVLVDFGLVSEHGPGARDARGLAGTLPYMAPEQLWGGVVGPATDWYGVGALLYETLTGRAPFAGGELYAPRRPPPRPRELVPATPADLDALVMDLLRPRPEERPEPAAILARLASDPACARPETPRPAAGPGRARFVGRVTELGRLEDAFAAGAGRALRLVAVQGPAGIGKSALVERFVAAREELDDALVLTARCHPQESLPFRAVDGIVDRLVDFVDAQAPDLRAELVSADGAVLARLFPVAAGLWPAPPPTAGEPHEVRRRAFAALRDLLAAVAARRPTVVWLDDLQWGDADSLALLRELVRPPRPPAVLLVVSCRSETDEGRRWVREIAGAAQLAPDDVVWLPLGALCDADARRLAEDLLGGAEHAADVAAEAGGNPLLVAELARHVAGAPAGPFPAAGLGFGAVIEARVARLAPDARRVLELVSLAGGPLAERLVYRLVPDGARAKDAVDALRTEGLLRTAVRSGELAFDTGHHRIAEVVSARLGAERRRLLHGEVAAALEAMPDADPHQLVEHHLAAGARARAGEHAYAAAERAVAGMAFHGAARLYRQALALGTAACPPWRLVAKLGEALVNAGRAAEGAARLAEAARMLAALDPDDREALRLERRAAEHYLRSGMPREGLAALRRVLGRLGIRYPRSPHTALARLVVNRARLAVLRRLPAAWPGPPAAGLAAERLEALWSAGVGLSIFDQIRAADFQVRHALLAHPGGDPAHLARSLATGALILAWEGGTRKRRRAQRLRHAGERLARETGDPNVRAHSLLMGAISAYYELRLREALALCEEGEWLCREHCVGAGWELANFQVLTGNTLACLGELPRLHAHLPEVLRQAREREDRYCLVIARLGWNNMSWLVADRAADARREAEDALAGPFPASFAWQVYQGAFALAQVDLYDGAGAAGLARSEAAWRALRARQMLRFLPTRVDMLHVRARCALRQAAGERGGARRRLVAVAERAARRIRREDAHWVSPFAGLLEAGALALGGARDAAARRLEEAAVGFEELDMALHAAAARRQVGVLAGRGPGADAEAWLRGRGVASPARLAAMLVPVGTPEA